MQTDSKFEVQEFFLTLRPLARDTEDGASVFESMWSSISSSIQLAQDYLEKDEEPLPDFQSRPMEGLESFANVIDNSK